MVEFFSLLGKPYEVNPAMEGEGYLRLEEILKRGVTVGLDHDGWHNGPDWQSHEYVQFRHNSGSVGLRGFCADPQNTYLSLVVFPSATSWSTSASTAQWLWRYLGFSQVGLNDRFRHSGSQVQLPRETS